MVTEWPKEFTAAHAAGSQEWKQFCTAAIQGLAAAQNRDGDLFLPNYVASRAARIADEAYREWQQRIGNA